MPPTAIAEIVLTEQDWTEAAQRHRARAERFLAAHTGPKPHPVWDFLFTYYSLRPRQLLRWHPGYGVVLGGAAARDYVERTGYTGHPAGATVSAAWLHARLGTVRFILDLLRRTAARPPAHNCFGLHEWAMVYRPDAAIRHGGVPLRLGQDGTDAVVESMPLRCSHYDAFRFFTADARPKNAVELSRETQAANEQPGCLHAAMDTYKWTFKLLPLTDSDLLLDCLELAADARELDMRASPYDLAEYGFAPIRIEDPAGRAEYVRAQAEITRRAAPLRDALIRRCELLVSAAEPA
ncbi:3-methyladenine DNA glycosylase [Mycolicibacterium confluentis]|uniref:Uncharacterized protein n=1 Tax=Mycolicibacterium confluentis TaxID=28047 RepID=A0A7I7XWS8_9MYCO|nr:3-methyladenine DNA glycosylase [Mycolicibacterium confluentis]MCV7321664.1 3-methyladenine DNA glycosylase [Mycolicibacterium confluentis]ORV31952.1 3-methyladenine DNA glycosylase [Mycolicibacterium confluentis]BBZ33473.1 hypothetical protein MCNF_20780 [Mycolicibacterium confluentis]